MTSKSKKKKKTNKRRLQLRIMKLTLFILVLALPCVWLVGGGRKESEPMRVARTFADHLVNGRYNEACALATPQSVDDVAFYALWRGEVSSECDSTAATARFKITHAQMLMPTDTTNIIKGKVLVDTPQGEEVELHRLDLKVIFTLDGWLVDYESGRGMWHNIHN